MSSTPDALWNDPAVRRLRPAAVLCRGLSHGTLLHELDLVVPVGWRLLIVARPEAAGRDLLRVIGGLARPRAGSVRLAGLDPAATQRAGGLVSYVGSETGLYPWMTPREVLTLAARLVAAGAERIEPLLARYGLLAAADRPMRRSGAGVRQRTALAAAMISDPQVLLLDEPLAAMDMADRRPLLVDDSPRRTLVLASRFPAREAGICDHVALIRDRAVAFVAAISDLDDAGLPLSIRGVEALAERGRSPDRAAPVARAG
jgi:ABC-type multidrug transport system ATPase subunit